MTLDKQISMAIGAHGLWKSRLRSAVSNGIGDLKLNVVRDDHACEFGKWLHGPELDAAVKSSKHHATCADLHHRFHGAAAHVLSLIAAGHKKDAEKALADNGDFDRTSSELTRAMMAWKSAAI